MPGYKLADIDRFEKPIPRDRLHNPYMMTKDNDMRVLKQTDLLYLYLIPLDADKNKQKEILVNLIELGNKVCLIFILNN